MDVAEYRAKLERFNVSENYKIDVNMLLERLHAIRFDSLLDIGCGTGYLVNLLRQKYPGKQIDGMDKYQYVDFGQFIADISAPNLKLGKKYDVITMVHSINHFSDATIAVKNISAMLNQGGHIIIINPNAHFVGIIKILNAAGAVERKGTGDVTVVSYLDADTIFSLFEKLDIKKVACEKYGNQISITYQEKEHSIKERDVLILKK